MVVLLLIIQKAGRRSCIIWGHIKTHAASPCLPVTETQKVKTRNRHQRRRMGRKVRSRETKPEFKIGMRRKVTRGKLLRRTKHTHPALLMASLCGRPRWPCGCRHTSFPNLLPSEQTTIFPLLFTPRELRAALQKPSYWKTLKKITSFFLPLTNTNTSSSYSRPQTTKNKGTQTGLLADKSSENHEGQIMCACTGERGRGWECAFIEWKPKNGSKQTSTTPIAGWYSSIFKLNTTYYATTPWMNLLYRRMQSKRDGWHSSIYRYCASMVEFHLWWIKNYIQLMGCKEDEFWHTNMQNSGTSVM